MAKLELFATMYCWECSSCKQRYDAWWHPVESQIVKPNPYYQWALNRPSFNYCPNCGEKIEKPSDGGS